MAAVDSAAGCGAAGASIGAAVLSEEVKTALRCRQSFPGVGRGRGVNVHGAREQKADRMRFNVCTPVSASTHST